MIDLSVSKSKDQNNNILWRFLGIFLLVDIIEVFIQSFLVVALKYDEYAVVQNPPYLYSLIWFISKLIVLVLLIIFYRKRMVECFDNSKKNIKGFLVFVFFSYLIFTSTNYIDTFYLELLGRTESSNQSNIIELFTVSSEPINYTLLFLTIVVIAPLLEELEYRELVFRAFNKCHFIIPCIISGLMFGIAHCLSVKYETIEEFFPLFLNELPLLPLYAIPGFLLSLFYHYSKNNFLATYIVHAVSNLFAFIAIIGTL